MAPITWRNVEAPDFRTALLGLNQAQQSFQGALTPIAEALKQREATADANWLNERTNNGNDFRAEFMNQFRTSGDLQSGLESGAVQQLLGRYQNIDKRPALDLIDNRLAMLRDRELTGLNYADRMDEVGLRPLLNQAGMFVANNDRKGFEAFMAEAPALQARYGAKLWDDLKKSEFAFSAEQRAAEANTRAGEAHGWAGQTHGEQMRDAPLRRELLRAQIDETRAQAAEREAKARGEGPGGAGGATLENRVYEREMDRAKEAQLRSPLAKGFLGEPDADDYVRKGIDGLFDKDTSAKNAAYAWIGKVSRDGITVEKDGKKIRYQVPAATALKLVEQNAKKFQGDDSLFPWKGSDPGAVSTALEAMFKDGSYLQSYAEGYDARTRLTDMQNLTRFPVGGAPGSGGVGGGTGSGGGGVTPAELERVRGRGDGQAPRADQPTPPWQGSGAAAPAAPGSMPAATQPSTNDALLGRLAQWETRNIEAGNQKDYSPEVKTFLEGQRRKEGGEARQAIKDVAGAVWGGLADVGAGMVDVATLAPRVAAKGLVQANNLALKGANLLGANIEPIQTGPALNSLLPTMEARMRRGNQGDVAQDLQAQREGLIKEFQAAGVEMPRGPAAPRDARLPTSKPSIYAGEEAWRNYRNPTQALARAVDNALDKRAGVTAVNTAGEPVGKAPLLPKSPLVPEPSKVSSSTTMQVGADGRVSDAPPAEIPKGVKFGKAETVVRAKKSVDEFRGGQGNTTVATYIMDGDTAVMSDGFTCRLDTIDAPETARAPRNNRGEIPAQAFGDQSRETLRSLIENKEVTVRVTQPSADEGGRVYCQVSVEGKQVDVEMVRAGMAELYTRYVRDKRLSPEEQTRRLAKAEILGDMQRQAQGSRTGMWNQPNYESPEAYRNRFR